MKRLFIAICFIFTGAVPVYGSDFSVTPPGGGAALAGGNNFTGPQTIDGDLEVTGTTTVEIIESHSPVKVKDGLLLLRDSDAAKEFHIFLSGEDTNSLSLSSAFDNTMVFATHGVVNNANDMSLMFWDGKTSRPTLVLDQGGTGRANIFERSLIVGDGLGAKPLDGDYTLGTATYANLSFDTGTNGADLGVEHDIEALGTIYTPTLRAGVINSEYGLNVNPESQGNVRFFDGGDVADATDGKRLYIYRRAVEGDGYMDFHIHRDQEAHFNSNVDIVLTDGITETLRISTTDHKVNAPFGFMSGGVDVLTSYTKYTDAEAVVAVEGEALLNLTGNLGVRIVPEYHLHIADDPGVVIGLEHTGSIVGMGENIGALLWKGGEAGAYEVGEIRLTATENWTATSSPTRMTFKTTAVGSTTGTERMRIGPDGLIVINVSLDVPGIANTSGDLKVMPDVQGDVILFSATDVADASNGKRLYVYRKAVEGDNYIRFYITAGQVSMLDTDINMYIKSGGYLKLQTENHIYLDLADNAGVRKVHIRDSDKDTVATIDSAGNADFASVLIDKGTGWGQATVDGSAGGCLMMRDTDDAGWTECFFLNGIMTCSIDADGVCDGA